MADITQRLAISQVAEQKGEQMSQYVQILAAFVAFVFFFGCFYDFARDFSCNLGKKGTASKKSRNDGQRRANHQEMW